MHMKLSELITKLQAQLDEYGDQRVDVFHDELALTIDITMNIEADRNAFNDRIEAAKVANRS